jgi:galactose oxidase
MNATVMIRNNPVARRAAGFRLFAAVLSLALTGALPGARAQADDPAVVGKWSAVQPWPFRGIHMQMLPTGKVMFWTRHPDAPRPRLWDPITSSLAGELPTAGWQEFCSSHVLLADGQMLMTGGHISGDGDGAPYAALFNSATNTWNRVANMNLGRWYPTSVVLGNGEVVVVSGTYNVAYWTNELPQVWSNGVWRDLTNAARYIPLYPDLHLAPNGKVFLAGPDQMTMYLDPTGTGQWTNVADRTFPNRDYGCSVLYDDGKVFFAGGGDPPTATAEVIDLNAAVPAWRGVGSMSAPRRQMNATLLPDGKILVTGGVSGAGFNDMNTPVLSCEAWDPVTETFTTWSSMAVGRWYHSTVVLLPDGRLLSAGGDGNHNAEIFSPPYLFQGPRPVITAAPEWVGYRQSFTVQTPDPGAVTNVNWVRLSSVTHANNMDQRINRLTFLRTETGVRVTAPANPNLCPPGYYMLFLLNEKGVPSVAKIIRIGGPLLAAPTNLFAGTVLRNRISLIWRDNAVGEHGYRVERSLDGVTFTPIGTVGPNVTSFASLNLNRLTRYYYRVQALSPKGNSAYSNVASARTH